MAGPAVVGLLPVIPTPFREGRFDADSFARLLEHMLPWLDGYTLLGSTGEAPSLTTDSYAHPTLSVMSDPALATHPGRTIALFVWLAIGWIAMQR